MQKTTAEIDHPYPVLRILHPVPHLLHSPAQVLQPPDMNATVCYGMQRK